MAQWNEIGGAFRRHDAGDPRGAQHVAFLGVAVDNELERLGAHHHETFRHCNALGRILRRHIDHMRFALGVDMGEGRFAHGVKMSLSPTMMRSFGTDAANASLVASGVSKVRRLRLLMPSSGERSLKALSSSS